MGTSSRGDAMVMRVIAVLFALLGHAIAYFAGVIGLLIGLVVCLVLWRRTGSLVLALIPLVLCPLAGWLVQVWVPGVLDRLIAGRNRA